MTRLLILSIAFVSTFASLSQDIYFTSKNQVGLSSHLLYDDNNSDPNTLEFFKDLEGPSTFLGSSILVNIPLSNRLTVSAGIGYLEHGVRYQAEYVTEPQDGIQEIYRVKTTYFHHNFTLPVQVGYQFTDRIDASFGLLNQIALNTDKRVVIHNVTTGKKSAKMEESWLTSKRKYNLAPEIAANYCFYNGSKLQLSSGLFGQFGLLKLQKSVTINRKYYAYGINFNISF